MLPALCIALATRLVQDGVARVDGVLPAALAADVRAVALAAAVPAQRQEVPLSLKSDAVASAAAAVAASPVGRALEDLCGGDAPLFDLCAVVSAPDAPIQPLHSDLGFDGAAAAPLYTCFVALQATPSALGPTEFCLGSHTDGEGKSDGVQVSSPAKRAMRGRVGVAAQTELSRTECGWCVL